MRDSTAAAESAATVLKRYMPIIIRPCTGTKPNTCAGGNSAPITSEYTGKRAEQVINGMTIMVRMRSRPRSIVRVAITAGTAQA